MVFTEDFYHSLFNNMLHGFAYCKINFDSNDQAVDYTYVIVNEAYESLTGLKDITGKKASEVMPGLRESDPGYFEMIGRIVSSGKPEKFETYVSVLERWFSISIYSPGKDHIVALVDNITEQKDSELKIIKLNRLYAFISQINQTIVHVKEEETLFRKACEIALEFGKFKMAWIGMLDREHKKINMIEERGTNAEDLPLFKDVPYDDKGPQSFVVNSGTSYICNDIENDMELAGWRTYAAKRGIRSCMVLPLKKGGVVVATFNLYSSSVHFFDKEEIALLEEASGDVSFAMDLFEKENLRMETEKKIVESEADLHAIFENASEGFVLLNTDFTVKAFNTNALRYSFLNSDTEIEIGQNVFNNFEKSRLDLLKSVMVKVMNGERVQYERPYDVKNGKIAWFSFSISPVIKNNEIQAICITGRDITTRKLIEQEREFDRNNLASLINNTQDLMWSVDRDFKLITFNSAFADMVKFLSGAVLAKGENVLANGFEPEQLNRFKGYYERAFTGEAFTEIEQSENYTSEISFYPIFSSETIIGTACYSRDITEKKNAEEQLRKSESDLKSANKDLETFIYRASHDLRGPLSSIIGLTNVSKLEITDQKAKQYLDMIQLSTKKLDDTLIGLVQSMAIKDISKFDDDVNFKSMIDDIFDRFQYYDGFSKVKFEVNINLSEPFISSRLILQPIIQNLIENSIKYRNINADKAVSRITVSDNANEVMIVFEDNGMGIDSAIHDKVFDVYYKGTQKSKGSGLGLYIVKTGIERLKGTIRLKSSPGLGSTFIITLPKSNGTK
ncbi:MAG: hypothetical protein JWP12_201 [Bacteroidetes bacterium]|nr:hypothetical protein [Bacteroidota bacterium]